MFGAWKYAGLALLAAVPVGCQRAEANRGAQVAAKVNGAEILVRQVNTAGGATGAQALEKIIDRELLAQKALAAGLDRDPAVAQAIDHARRQVLAQAWIERAAGAAAKPSAEEIRAFYHENEALFARRRIYRLQELVVSSPAGMLEVLRAEAGRASSLEQVAAWLRARSAEFREVAVTQPAEQLPLRYLPQLARMKAGDMAVLPSPLGASVVQLVHAQEAPLTEQQAAPLIEQFLEGRKRLETAAAEVRRLREVASIEYMGEFRTGK
ncbi:MAG: peptidyl-prolyl cis-trans isomerase, EpsD family [Betaproteobacteria bacterium]|nr:MAG: peptidyl-prolyl cis-trans isomerase, EpsD family [Betaproteobacteria bacterium]